MNLVGSDLECNLQTLFGYDFFWFLIWGGGLPHLAFFDEFTCVKNVVALLQVLRGEAVGIPHLFIFL